MSKPNKRDPALLRAIKAAGGVAALAEYINAAGERGISSQAISQWTRCPIDRVLVVEAATGGKVTRHELHPKAYPDACTAPKGNSSVRLKKRIDTVARRT